MRTRRTYSIKDVPVTAALTALAFLFMALPATAQDRPITLKMDRYKLGAVCETLVTGFDIPLVYLDGDVRDKIVSVDCDGCTIEQLLDDMLEETGLTWKRINRQYVISKRAAVEPAPRGTLYGTVRDSVTGEPVAGAAVLLYHDHGDDLRTVLGSDADAGTGTDAVTGADGRIVPSPPSKTRQTNGSGFFSLPDISPGKYYLSVRMIGYRPNSTPCSVEPGSSIEVPVQLVEKEIRMDEVVIRGWRSAFSISEAVSHGVYVPATPADQNQYFIDGVRIYNPSHHGALVSTFSEGALNDIEPRSGGIPPAYGGRIGGILDLSLREGSMARLSGVGTAGTLGSSIMLNGPVAGATTFMVSGRQGYPSLTGPFDPGGGPLSDAHASEILSKLTLRTSGTGRLFLTGYFGRDSYGNRPRSESAALANHLTWRNAALSLRWAGVIPPSLFVQVSGGFTGYDFTATHDLMNFVALGNPSYRSEYRIGDFHMRADAEHYYDDWHTVQGGVSVVRHGMSGSVSPFTIQGAVLPWDRSTSWELSVYMQDQWRVTSDVLAEIGMRATSFVTNDGSRSGVDPRFSIFVSPADRVGVHASLTSVTQYLHPYRNSGIFLFYPTIFWYPSDSAVDPSTSHQGTLGAEYSFDDGFTAGIDASYRLTKNAHEFLFDPNPDPSITLDDVAISGTEKAWGVQLGLHRSRGVLTGFLRYNLSWLTRRFDELNGGLPFVPRFHRRHEVAAGLEVAVAPGWTLDALAAVASDQSPSFNQKGEIAGGFGGVREYDLNGGRLAGFQRVEVGVTKTFAAGRTPVALTLRMVNAYGLVDLFDWQLTDTPDLRQMWTAEVRQASLFPKYPTLNLRVYINEGTMR